MPGPLPSPTHTRRTCWNRPPQRPPPPFGTLLAARAAQAVLVTKLKPLFGSHWPAYLLLLLFSWFSTLHILLRMNTQTRKLAVRNSEPSKTISQFCPCILGPYQYITNTLLLSHCQDPQGPLFFSRLLFYVYLSRTVSSPDLFSF